jgi:NADPH:quinone reductase-like Zn-dependent oxidoreductase
MTSWCDDTVECHATRLRSTRRASQFVLWPASKRILGARSGNNSSIRRCHISSVALVYRVRQASEQDVVTETKQLTAGNGAEPILDPVGGPGFTRLAHSSAVGGTLILYGALAQNPVRRKTGHACRLFSPS